MAYRCLRNLSAGALKPSRWCGFSSYCWHQEVSRKVRSRW